MYLAIGPIEDNFENATTVVRDVRQSKQGYVPIPHLSATATLE